MNTRQDQMAGVVVVAVAILLALPFYGTGIPWVLGGLLIALAGWWVLRRR